MNSASGPTTDLDALIARLRQAVGAPAQTIARLSDELLETPLTVPQQQQLRQLHAAAGQLLTVVNSFTDYAHLEDGELTLHQWSFSLRDLMARLAGDWLQAARDRRVVLKVAVDGDAPDGLTGDPGRLGEVLAYAIEHAIRRTRDGEVTLGVETEFITKGGTTLAFSVAATAPPGSQSPLAIDSADLGFKLAARIAAAMGGKLRLTRRADGAEALGFSATFAVREKQGRSEEPPRFANITGLPVLLVSDNAAERDELSQLAQTWHMRPVEADSGEMAIAMLERAIESERPIPLLLLADRIQDQDAFVLAFQVKHHRRISATRMILITREGRRGDALRCRENGIAAYLPRPLNPLDLHAAVQSVLGAQPGDHQRTLVTRHSLREQRHAASILLVESDRAGQLLGTHFLDPERFSVALAAGGDEAIALTSRQRFDLILLDMQLAGADALAVTRRIRLGGGEGGGMAPIIALTPSPSPERVRELHAAGITDYLVTPLKRDALLAMVARYVKP